ncbi:MAG: Ig-like domain repeat protein [Acidobacteriota bacterium]
MVSGTLSPFRGGRASRSALLALLWIGLAAFAGAQTFVIDSVGDEPDASAGDGLCLTLKRSCTLRAAIEAANQSASATIQFAVLGSGVQTILPASPLPSMNSAVTLDGYTQPGASPNTSATSDNAVLLIEIDGSNAGATNGLSIFGARSVIRGLVVNRFTGNGLAVFADSVQVLGCFVGTSPSGLVARPNSGNGIVAGAAVTPIVIGGPAPASRNVISGNALDGIFAGTRVFVQGSFIGTDATGAAPLGNAGHGISIGNSGSGDQIGGTGAGQGNVIAFNGLNGVLVSCGDGCGVTSPILSNSIFSNFGAGISLGGGAAPLANDPCDADFGANESQNTPVLTSAVPGASSIAIQGTLDSVASTAYRVEFFSSPSCDASGSGEGKTFLGATTVTTNASCTAAISVVLPVVVAAGQAITATATDPAGNTSEFSRCVGGIVQTNTSTVVLSSVNPSNVGQPVTFTAIVSASGPAAGGPTGSVTFFDATTPLATVTLISGQASFTTSTLSAGSHPITAVYSGDSAFRSSASPVLTQVVGTCAKAATVDDLSIAPSSGAPGDVYTLIWSDRLAGQSGQYEVFLSTDGGATFRALSYTRGTSFSGVINNVSGTVLAFYVRAEPFCSGGSAAFSDPGNIVRLTVTGPGCARPLSPSVILDKTSVTSGATYTLTWSPTLPIGTGGGPAGVYRILQAVGSGAFTSIGTTTSTTFSAPAPNVSTATPVFLEVRAEPSCSTDPALFSPPSSPARFDALPGCGGLPVPANVSVTSAQSLGAPTPTDFINVSWTVPAGGSATRYGVRINGDAEVFTTGLSAILPPRGNRLEPITAFVRAYGCSPEVSGNVVQSDSIALQTVPPAANFTVSPSARVGVPVVFTDTSSPQATNWLWIFDDGAVDTRQSPSHLFVTAGSHTVFLVATNGAGSSSRALTLTVLPASASALAERRLSPQPLSFDASDPERRTARVRLAGIGSTWLYVRTREAGETILFLRFLAADGSVAAERRLSVTPGDEAVFDLGAYGLAGEYSLELVGAERFDAHILQSRRPDPKEVRR